jgi:hypothetical protein
MIPFQAPDGTRWGVEVRLPSHSSAFVVFHHPTGETARLDRYAWMNVRTPEARDPGTSLGAKELTAMLDERTLARLFRRSMPVSSERPSYIVS